METTVTEKVSIGNPIGNLYRKKHVLVLVEDQKGRFVLGKKKDFYPNHIARMLGGGMKEGEGPELAAKREILEELAIDLPVSTFKLLGSVVTEAKTSEGEMQMQTWIYKVVLPGSAVLNPSDDISEVQFFSKSEYAQLIQDMQVLSGEFKTDKYSFLWSDWGKIYAPIHSYAIEWSTN